jgi:hypothetical protein
MSRLPMNELPELFPYVEAWVTGLQQQANANGTSYPLYYPYARAAGVIHPQKIRILSTAAIPNPTHPRIAELAKEIGLLTPATGAITAGYGIVVRADCVNDLRLIVHELVHVARYERLGVADFLREYIRQLNEHGYNEAPFEVEAAIKTADILRWQ